MGARRCNAEPPGAVPGFTRTRPRANVAEAGPPVQSDGPGFPIDVHRFYLSSDGVDDLLLGDPRSVPALHAGPVTGPLDPVDAVGLLPDGAIAATNAGDVDGDGYADLLVTYDDGAELLLGPVEADLAIGTPWAVVSDGASVVAGDADGDGAIDLAGLLGSELAFMHGPLGSGTLALADGARFDTPDGAPRSVSFGPDPDGDGARLVAVFAPSCDIYASGGGAIWLYALGGP